MSAGHALWPKACLVGLASFLTDSTPRCQHRLQHRCRLLAWELLSDTHLAVSSSLFMLTVLVHGVSCSVYSYRGFLRSRRSLAATAKPQSLHARSQIATRERMAFTCVHSKAYTRSESIDSKGLLVLLMQSFHGSHCRKVD